MSVSVSIMADKPKRHWYQYSLRTLLGVVFVAALAFGWLGWKIQRIRDEVSAVRELEAVGAKIARYDQRDSPRDQWLWKWFGDRPVCVVHLSKTQVTDADLEHLKRLTEPKIVMLGGTRITDRGLEHVAGLTSLEVLYLYRTNVADAGLEHLSGLVNLKHLSLDKTGTSDAGLRQLRGLTALKCLDLNDTTVTDAGLEHLKELPLLSELQLKGTRVTGEGVKKLQQALRKCDIITR
jgi:hypothetical protein